MRDRQTPSTCANSLKIAGVVGEEGPGFGTEANEASAQQLQRTRPASDSLQLCCSSCDTDPQDPKTLPVQTGRPPSCLLVSKHQRHLPHSPCQL